MLDWLLDILDHGADSVDSAGSIADSADSAVSIADSADSNVHTDSPRFGGYSNSDGTYHYDSDNTDRDPSTGAIIRRY